ncbi:hypothetical protein [Bradyrhizobium japonicum]|uniref:hypothetical protein n=1 Tax=Bradyrhizobium japonicum TaxID=375 RepID=UPI000462CE02|nr:hypothetical protein [Bradyrhizobium japonicum]
MSNYLKREQERDFLLSSIISLESLAKGGKLTNENVLEVTRHILSRIEPTSQPHASEQNAAPSGQSGPLIP